MQTAQFVIIAISFSSHKALYYPRDTYLHVTRGQLKETHKQARLFYTRYVRQNTSRTPLDID